MKYASSIASFAALFVFFRVLHLLRFVFVVRLLSAPILHGSYRASPSLTSSSRSPEQLQRSSS